MRFLDRFKKKREDEGDSLTPHEEAEMALRAIRPGFFEAVVAMSKNDCEETRLAFHRIILSGTLWYPMGEQTENGAALTVIPFPDGTGFAWPVYTEPESMRLDGYDLDGHFMISRTDLIFQTAENNGFGEVHINPAGPAGAAIMEQEIPFLARGRSPYGDLFSDPPTEMSAGTPERSLPDRLLKPVLDFASKEGVEAAYYLDLVTDRKESYPSVYFDYRKHPEKAEEAKAKIEETLRPFFQGTPYVLASPLVSDEQFEDFVKVGIKIYPAMEPQADE